MGCASAVNRKEDDDSKRVIRLDLQTIKSTGTPKNEINLMKLTEQLLKVLEVLCGEDKTKFEKFQDQIINNTIKLEKKQDEVSYLISISKEQIALFQENGNILNLCYDLIAHLAKMLELNQKTFYEKEEWYYRFSYVLIYEIAEFKNILAYIIESPTLKQQYCKKAETIFLYACLLGAIRFLEGISWGYSVYLMHQQLDQDNIYSVKVLINLMLRLKQSFKENRDFTNCFINDKPAYLLSYSSIEKLVTDTENKKDDRKNQFNSYLSNQVFRKTYVQVKKQIDDWLRKVQQYEVTVNDLKKYKNVKNFTRSFLRELKNPILKNSTGEYGKPLSDISSLPNFEIDNTPNLMVLLGNDQDTKLIVESFLQANIKARTKYKCCVLHHCIKENKITKDSYYIVKNIIYQIMRCVPSLRNYIKLSEHNFVKEMMQQFDQDKLDLQREYPDILVKFFKVLKELRLDFNIGIFLTGFENIFEQNKLDNIIYILRSCSLYFPNFIKIVLTMEKRQTNEAKVQKIIRLLQTQTIVEVNDSETFDVEGRSYLEFALLFGAGAGQVQSKQNNTTNLIELDDNEDQKLNNNVTMKDNLELCLQKSDGSYSKGIQIIHGLFKKQINFKDQKAVREFISKFQYEDETYIASIQKSFEIDQSIAEQVLVVLTQLYGPIHVETLLNILSLNQQDQNFKETARNVLKAVADLLNLQNSQIAKVNPIALTSDYLDNPKTLMILKKKTLVKSLLINNFKLAYDKNLMNQKVFTYHQSVFESGEVENEFEDLDSYLRLYVFKHIAKSNQCIKVFAKLENLFSVKNLYKQILYHKGYFRFRTKLQDLADSQYFDKDEKQQLISFMNILYLIEQTIKNEPLNFLDFCTQLRGRILGEQLSDFLSDLRLDITSENICYFKNFHHALRENPRIDIILKFPRCTVLRIKFFQDKKRILLSLSNGLMIIYNTVDYCIQKIFTNKMAVIDSLKLIDDKYVITAGIDPKIRIWNIESEKLISKFEVHSYSTILMSYHKEYIFSYGYDMKLCKYNFKNKQLEASQEMDSVISALKLLKTLDESCKLKLAAGFVNGNIVLYDLNLQKLQTISLKTVNEEVIQLINMSNTHFLCFTKEGSISIMNNTTLEEQSNNSIFNLKSEDYIDLILINSREYFLFTLEKQKIEFYSANTFKRTDSWDYFFERDLICCDKNKEGSKIFVSDKGYDPVVCIEVTEKLETNSIVSCSQDRDLRIWRRDNGVFIKKYDLSSFTGENITSMKLGKDENMLFLGSKDMNVYLIDISKGKLCVVYEGHWNRVTQIYTIPNKDILITISESNIKVWDLEYDECIKNMNEHNSSIVYISQSPQDEEQVMTIGQSFELKVWNYVTGTISHSHEIELNKSKKQLKNLNVICCDVQQDMAYIALNTNEISVYSIKENKVLYSFISYNDEQIIFLNGIKTENANYLIVVTRTACVLYLVQKDQVKRLCSYLVNARKKPKKKKHDNKYSYNVRYYFTSAKIVALNPQLESQNYVPIRRPGNRPGGVGSHQNLNLEASMNNLSPEKNLNKDMNRGVDDESSNIQFGNTTGFMTGFAGGLTGSVNNSKENNTKIIDTMGTKIKDTVVLVCLGDSRGFVHMNHLILK